jgi:hypothetical protein
MKGRSLLLYLFVTAINMFLVLPVLFYPLLIAPLHVLIFILSFDWLLKKKIFKTNWNKMLFAAIPAFAQMTVIVTAFYEDTFSPAALLNFLNSFFIALFFIFCLIEFGILLLMYSKYVQRHNV